jgi:ABC-type glycerol-3-phosphate transport system permease component
MTLTNMLGWFAAGLVFATFCANQMAPLRALAIVSNVAFIGYGYVDDLWPIVVLHVTMLPMNVIRFRQALREVGASAQEKGGVGAPPDPVVVPNEFRELRPWTGDRELAAQDGW